MPKYFRWAMAHEIPGTCLPACLPAVMSAQTFYIKFEAVLVPRADTNSMDFELRKCTIMWLLWWVCSACCCYYSDVGIFFDFYLTVGPLSCFFITRSELSGFVLLASLYIYIRSRWTHHQALPVPLVVRVCRVPCPSAGLPAWRLTVCGVVW